MTDIIHSLAAVNAALACVGVIQCTRIFLYEQSKTGSAKGAVKELEFEAKETAEKFKQDVEKGVQKVAK